MKVISKNRKILFDYAIRDTFIAGISLLGSEVKSIKNSDVVLKGSYVLLTKDSNLEIINMNVSNNNYYTKKHNELRSRQLLLNKNEIRKIEKEVNLEKATILPKTILINKNGLIKVEIVTAKPKNKSDKRETDKKRDLQRETKMYV